MLDFVGGFRASKSKEQMTLTMLATSDPQA